MRSHLEASFLRCFQRLSFPNIATRQCHWRDNRNTRGSSLRSSRTRSSPLKSQTSTADRDRTVSRRSKPSSRTTLNGEQPYPWDRLQPQDVMSRHRGAKHRRRYELLGGISLLSRSTFYPLSDGPSIQNHRITKTYFRTCSTCLSRSQARFCLYTLRPISDRSERTFVLLRYSLGGDRPSQTAHHTLSSIRITDQS